MSGTEKSPILKEKRRCYYGKICKTMQPLVSAHWISVLAFVQSETERVPEAVCENIH